MIDVILFWGREEAETGIWGVWHYLVTSSARWWVVSSKTGGPGRLYSEVHFTSLIRTSRPLPARRVQTCDPVPGTLPSQILISWDTLTPPVPGTLPSQILISWDTLTPPGPHSTTRYYVLSLLYCDCLRVLHIWSGDIITRANVSAWTQRERELLEFILSRRPGPNNAHWMRVWYAAPVIQQVKTCTNCHLILLQFIFISCQRVRVEIER